MIGNEQGLYKTVENYTCCGFSTLKWFDLDLNAYRWWIKQTHSPLFAVRDWNEKNIEMQSMKSFEHRSSLLHGIRPFIYRSYQLRSLLVPFLYFNWLFVYQGSSFFSSWNNHNYNFIYFLTWYFYKNRSLNLLVDLSYEITGGRIHTSDFLTKQFF